MTLDAVRPARPAQVTIAFWCQLAAAALLLGIVGLAVAHAVHFDGEISRVAALVPDADPDEVSAERTSNVFASLVVGVPTLLLALWLGVTAVPVRRGSNIARIFVFVAGGGQFLLCGMQGFGGFMLAPLLLLSDDGDVTVEGDVPYEESEFSSTLYSSPDEFSDVVFGVGVLCGFVVLVLSFAVVLLLALPPAHRYFVPSTPAPVAAPVWALHPGGGPVPVPYLICPDPSAHYPRAATPAEPGNGDIEQR